MSWLTSLDRGVLFRVHRLLHPWRQPWQVRLARTLTRAGDADSWILVSLALLVSGDAARRIARRIGSGALIAAASSQALKRTCKRSRPSPDDPAGFAALVDSPDAFSFPSGHTAAAFAVAVALAGQGRGLGALASALAIGIGMSRVYLGVHYPLDVVAGAALGTAAGLCTRYLLD